jgi:hypothetical protein
VTIARQPGGAAQLAGAQVLQRFIRFLEAELSNRGAHGHLRRELHELLAVATREVRDRPEDSLTPEQLVRE